MREGAICFGLDANDLIFFDNQVRHTGLEMHLAAAVDDGVAHVLDDAGQTVGTDVGMGIGQDIGGGAVLAEHVEYLLGIAALLGTGVELAVGIGTGTALAKAVVALSVHLLRLGDECQVVLPVAHILAALHHDGTVTQLDETEGSKQAAGTCTHDHHRGTAADVGIDRQLEIVVGGLFVDIHPDLQVHEDGALAGIDAALEHPDMRNTAQAKPLFVRQIVFQRRFVGRLPRQQPQLIFLYHRFLSKYSTTRCWASGGQPCGMSHSSVTRRSPTP